MDGMLMKKLEMAARVRQFLRAHPYSDRNQAAIVAQFEARLAQAEAHCRAEQEQRAAANEAMLRRQEIRRHLETQVIRAIVGIGAFAMRGDAQVAGRFVGPATNGSHAAFLVRATSLLEVAREHQEALIESGLARGQLGEFAAALREFRDASAQMQANERLHRESRVAFTAALAEVARLLGVLDALSLGRLRDDPALLRMWRTVRTVDRLPRTRSPRGGEAPPDGAVAPPVVPGADGEPGREDGQNRAA